MRSLLSIVTVICVSVGFPLNLFVAGAIIVRNALHRPRHICWLGVTFSSLFAQLLSLNELLSIYIIPESKLICWTLTVFAGIPYATLFQNLFLCLLDRFVAITYPIWHKSKVTVSRIVKAQLIGVLLVSVLFKISTFVDDTLTNINCHQQVTHGKTTIFTLTLYVALCLAAQIIVYFKTKMYVVKQREGQCGHFCSLVRLPTPIRSQIERRASLDLVIQETSMMASGANDTGAIRPRRPRLESESFVHVSSETISKLEMEAAWTLAQGLTSLIIISSPILVTFFGIVFCSYLYDDCTTNTWTIPYFLQLVTVHTTYNPIMYLWRSHEFGTVLRLKNCI